MSNYNFIPFLKGVFRYDLALFCYPCKNLAEAKSVALNFKSNLDAELVTIVKHITQI